MAGPRNSARVAGADLVPCLLWIGMRVRLRLLGEMKVQRWEAATRPRGAGDDSLA